jgi:DNA-binding CsgD family transcriptional regulator
MTSHADLTERELDVAELVAQALPNKLIASRLGISCGRVRALITSAAYKIGANAAYSDRVQIAVWWVQQPAMTKRHSA